MPSERVKRTDTIKWDTIVCHKTTAWASARSIAAILFFCGMMSGQNGNGPSLDWRRVGGPAVELMLASPATGAVDRVWFAADGSRLYARTRTGRLLETQDFENWSLSAAVSAPASALVPAEAPRAPEAAASVVKDSSSGRLYALGRQLYRSDDGGKSWTNLTAYRLDSVIGPGQRSVAISPNDPDQIVVANDFGVWRSLDGGISWSGLNRFLPNLPRLRHPGHAEWHARHTGGGRGNGSPRTAAG